MKTIALGLAAVCLAGGFASAHTPSGPAAYTASQVVRYTELDLAHEPGAKVLLARIKRAAHAVCGPQPSLLSLGENRDYDTCVDTSIRSAVTRVDAPLVTAIYDGVGVRVRLANR